MTASIHPLPFPPHPDGPQPSAPATTTPPAGRVAFSVRDVAELLGVHRNTVYNQIRAGTIPVVYVGRKPLVPRRWIDEHFGFPADEVSTDRR